MIRPKAWYFLYHLNLYIKFFSSLLTDKFNKKRTNCSFGGHFLLVSAAMCSRLKVKCRSRPARDLCVMFSNYFPPFSCSGVCLKDKMTDDTNDMYNDRFFHNTA